MVESAIQTGKATVSSTNKTEELDVVDASALLNQLDDDVNRCFLNLMSIDWYTAQELTDVCGTPLSTTYRKLNRLDTIGVLEQRIRVSSSGKHPEEFRCKPVVLTLQMGQASGLEMNVATQD